MGNTRRAVFLILLAALFVEVLLIFPQSIEKKTTSEKVVSEEKSETEILQNTRDQKASGVHLFGSQDGAMDWELYAKEAEGSQGQGNWRMRDVRAQFYNGNVVEFTVTGKFGKIDSVTKNMTITGAVQTTSVNGYLFSTEEIQYQSRLRQIVSPGQVYMRGPKDNQGPGFEVRGEGMLVDVASSKMKIHRHVRGHKKIKNQNLILTASSAEFSGKNNTAFFQGDVGMDFGYTRLEAPEALFSGSQGVAMGLDKVLLSGGVAVRDGDRLATSEKLDLDLLARQFVFTGAPKVHQNGDLISGEQITFLDGGKKVRVERVRANVKEEKRK